MSPLIRRTVVPGMAYTVARLDDPTRLLAVALRGPDGWQVAGRDRIVGRRMEQREAAALMLATALTTAGGIR